MCSVVGCEKGVWAKELCSAHYQESRARLRGTPKAEGQKLCLIDGCVSAAASKGLCAKHYASKRRRDRGIVPLVGAVRGTYKKPCRVEGCGKLNKARGLCQAHYGAVRRRETGTPAWKPRAQCSIEGCDKTQHAKGFCVNHYGLLKRNGDARLNKRPNGTGYVDSYGYKLISVAGRQIREHRHIMEQRVGRTLMKHETVHHKNGDKLDNRLENLELWSSSQPYGQRVDDKVKWAIELLLLYAPQKLRPAELDGEFMPNDAFVEELLS